LDRVLKGALNNYTFFKDLS